MNKQNVLSVKVSKEDHATVKQLATEMKMNISDFITNKLFRNEGEPDSRVVRTPSAELVEKLANDEVINKLLVQDKQRLDVLTDELKETLKEKEIENKSLQEKVESLSSKVPELEEKLSRVDDLMVRHKDYVDSLNADVSSLNKKIEEMNDESAQQKQALHDVRTKLKSRNDIIEELSTEIIQTKNSAIAAQDETIRFQKELRNTSNMNSELKQKIQDLVHKHNEFVKEARDVFKEHAGISFSLSITDYKVFLNKNIWK